MLIIILKAEFNEHFSFCFSKDDLLYVPFAGKHGFFLYKTINALSESWEKF